MEIQTNPLKSYFRKPGIWIILPSKGKYYNTKPSELNSMGEIPVYPMTAKDELLMKNADALLNGNAIKQLMQSCVPCIDDPFNIPAVDLDAILLAIRRCTYGDTMSIESDCTHCLAKNEINLNLDYFISSIRTIDEIDPITLESGIKVYIRPVNVNQLLELNWVQYEQIRSIQVAEQDSVDEKSKIAILQKSYEELTNINIKIVSECIDTVLLPDGVTVTDTNNIKDWIIDLSHPQFKLIENSIMHVGLLGVKKNITNECEQCHKEFESTIDFNPTTFFA